MKLKITADSQSGIHTLATARTLKNLVKRINKDAKFWREMGWDCFQLEGYTTQEALAAYRADEISFDDYKWLLELAAK